MWRAIGIMYNMSYKRYGVGTAEFREHVSSPKLRTLLGEHQIVTVGRYNHEPDAVVVAPELFAELEQDHERLEQMRALLPILAAALSVGAALPSSTLAAVGIELPDATWQTLNELQRRFRVRPTRSEDGARLETVRFTSSAVRESDEELLLLDD
ncbi:MAG: hypothetical protein ACR2KK_12110 [Acidimicrobiales bacterium]